MAKKKNYKKWKESFNKENTIGLGDLVEKVTEATGIKKAVKFIAGEDCGCEERKQKMNAIPLLKRRNVNCLTEEEYAYLTDWFSKKVNVVEQADQNKLLAIYNRVFNQRRERTSCGSCIKTMIDELKVLFNQYN
tara:strand:- start:19067 stop:19468 length:402 start_codon:yes stop_codon:yes gene_type:complete